MGCTFYVDKHTHTHTHSRDDSTYYRKQGRRRPHSIDMCIYVNGIHDKVVIHGRPRGTLRNVCVWGVDEGKGEGEG